MKNLWLFLFLMIATAEVEAHGQRLRCDANQIQNDESADQVVEACRKSGVTRRLSYLPERIMNQIQRCQDVRRSSATPAGSYQTCMTGIAEAAQSVLACPQSPARQREAVDFDLVQIDDVFGRLPKVAVPALIQAAFDSLTKTADEKFPRRFGASKWKLIAYEAPIVNATAAAGGTILISDAFWKDPTKTYPEDEIAAVLAHEIGHVLMNHSLHLGCLAVEWVGTEYDVETATRAFREDLAEGLPRKEAWKRMSQAFEYEADALSARLLTDSGRDPKAMLRALERMRPKEKSGFAVGSHPDMDERIERLR